MPLKVAPGEEWVEKSGIIRDCLLLILLRITLILITRIYSYITCTLLKIEQR
jgi:hypothetical protein